MGQFRSALKYWASTTTFRNHKDNFFDLYHEVRVADLHACRVGPVL
jgi:hypothetical protein